MTKQEAIALCMVQPEVAAEIILMVETLEARIKELEAKCKKDSSNSSKPPSSDNKLSSKKKRVQKSSERKRGGKLGHKGKNLKMVEHPDEVVSLKPKVCHKCQGALENVSSNRIVKRQLFDFPQIDISVTEYQQHKIECPHCQTMNKEKFPPNIKATTQYGENIKAFVAYLNTQHMIPYERISQIIEDMVSHKVSTGTIYNFLSEGYEKLEEFEEKVKDKLIQEEVLNADETGVRVTSKLNWIHVVTSPNYVHYGIHAKRGREAMDEFNILPNYKGVLSHDHWSPYNAYEHITHSYCNAHIIRELQFQIDNHNSSWAKEMQILLKEMNKAVIQAKEKKKNALDAKITKNLVKKYDFITKKALKTYPPPKSTNKRGRPKQEKGKNLLDRLITYKEETLRFLYDFRVPFTNNLAERDLRMIKVKQKISGTFASFSGGEFFCRIKSFIGTLQKQNLSILDGLKLCYRSEAVSNLGW
jgi:transposase